MQQKEEQKRQPIEAAEASAEADRPAGQQTATNPEESTPLLTRRRASSFLVASDCLAASLSTVDMMEYMLMET